MIVVRHAFQLPPNTQLLCSLLFYINKSAAVWNGADCLLLHKGPISDDDVYHKSTLLHQWLFGYELPDTILLLRKDGHAYFLGTKKKCDFLQSAVNKIPEKSPLAALHLMRRNKEDNDEKNYETLMKEAFEARMRSASLVFF